MTNNISITLEEAHNNLMVLKAQAAVLNAKLTDTEIGKDIRDSLRRDYAVISAKVAEAKKIRTQAAAAAKKESDIIRESNKDNPGVRITCLTYPKTGRVKYFASEMSAPEVMMMLYDVYDGSDLPSVSSSYLIHSSEVETIKQIPKEWYELETN